MANPNSAPFNAYAQLLPSDEDAERFAISSALRFEYRMREYAVLLQTEHFSSSRHKIIWDIMREMHDADLPVTLESLLVELNKKPQGYEQVGGIGYLIDSFQGEAVDVKAEIWAKPILETYARRRLILKCNEVMIRLGDRSDSPASICQEIEDEARTCATVGETSMGFATFTDVVRECGGMDAFLSRGAGDAVSYPWYALNLMTNGGMRPGQVIVIAGPSGMGKTTLALNIAFSAAASESGAPIIFSLEMDKVELESKLLSLAARVDSYHFRNPDEAERNRIRDGSRVLANMPIFIDDEECMTIPSMTAKVKKKMAVEPISMVLIDYVQLVEGKRNGGETREQEISKIMRSIKRMAKKLKVPVVVLSQINEDTGAGNREPELKDLRESRSIGHTANLAAFLWFTRRYDMANGIPTGELDLIIRKQRGGPEGRIHLVFHAPTGRFYEPERVRD